MAIHLYISIVCIWGVYRHPRLSWIRSPSIFVPDFMASDNWDESDFEGPLLIDATGTWKTTSTEVWDASKDCTATLSCYEFGRLKVSCFMLHRRSVNRDETDSNSPCSTTRLAHGNPIVRKHNIFLRNASPLLVVRNSVTRKLCAGLLGVQIFESKLNSNSGCSLTGVAHGKPIRPTHSMYLKTISPPLVLSKTVSWKFRSQILKLSRWNWFEWPLHHHETGAYQPMYTRV